MARNTTTTAPTDAIELEVANLEGTYLREMGEIPRASRDEELRLAARIETARDSVRELFARPPVAVPRTLGEDFAEPRGRTMEETLTERIGYAVLAELDDALDRDPPLAARMRKSLGGYRERLHEALKAVDEAKRLLTEANLRLVVHLAKQHRRDLPLMDLIQEGNLGLMKAVERYQADLGFRFSTYAAWWIHQNMRRGTEYQCDVVRIPAPSSRRRREEAKRAGVQRDAKPSPPWKRSKSERMAMHDDQAKRRPRRATILPLDIPAHDNRPELLRDALPDPGADEVAFEWAAQRQTLELLQEGLETLKPRSREILERRFGLDGEEPETLRQLAARLSVSRERVRQIEQEAIRQVAAELQGRGVADLG